MTTPSPYGAPVTPPVNAPAGAQPFLGLQAGVSGAVVTANIVQVFGAGGGIFIYSGTPQHGNLIGSWAGMGGTDPFGNAYPQGLNVTIGTISGSSITASTFQGTDFIINTAGAFFYSEAI
jgi:hypothetical protein